MTIISVHANSLKSMNECKIEIFANYAFAVCTVIIVFSIIELQI